MHISQCCSLLTGHPSCMDVLETQSLDHRKRPEAPKTVCESQRVGRIQCMMHSPFPLVFLFTISFSLRTMCICVRFLPTDLAFLLRLRSLYSHSSLRIPFVSLPLQIPDLYLNFSSTYLKPPVLLTYFAGP